MYRIQNIVAWKMINGVYNSGRMLSLDIDCPVHLIGIEAPSI